MLSKCKKIVYNVTFWSKRIVDLQCKQKHRGFREDENSNRREVLIREFHKKLLKSAPRKNKVDPRIAIWGSLIRTLNCTMLIRQCSRLLSWDLTKSIPMEMYVFLNTFQTCVVPWDFQYANMLHYDLNFSSLFIFYLLKISMMR